MLIEKHLISSGAFYFIGQLCHRAIIIKLLRHQNTQIQVLHSREKLRICTRWNSIRKDQQQLQIGGKLVAIAASFFFALNFC